MSSIFDFLKGILFAKTPLPAHTVEDERGFDLYMINRWCSMVDKDSARIINETTNKFGPGLGCKQDQYNFLKDVLPKYKFRKIEYIKRKTVD